MVSLILLGRKFFTFDKTKTALDALFLTTLRWWFQLRFSSKWTPTNLKDSFLHPVPTLSISLLSIWNLSEVILTSSFLFLFALNQSSILERRLLLKNGCKEGRENGHEVYFLLFPPPRLISIQSTVYTVCRPGY